jgi:microcystin-dependent protein
MATPFIGEIRMFAGNFAPQGWAFCDGQTLAISQNDALFALIGTTYGGDGQTTFNLPDLRSRLPVHNGQLTGGSNYVQGSTFGVETVTLNTQQMATHNHAVQGAGAATSVSPAGAVYAGGQGNLNLYATAAPNVPMAAGMVQSAGGSQPHDNIMPYLAIRFIIALEGIFPSRN